MKKKNTNHKRHLAIGAGVIMGLTMIVGATLNLPASAQGVVTGRNEIVIEQLADQVGPRALVQATIDDGLLPANILNGNGPTDRVDRDERQNRRQEDSANRDGSRQRREGRNGERRNGERRNGERRNGGQPQVNDEIIDRLERIGPETVVQAAVDAGLITNAEAERLLAQ